MVRIWADIRRIREQIETKEVVGDADAPQVIDANDAGFQNKTYSPAKSGFQIQMVGPDKVKVRINGDAGIADTEYNQEMTPDSYMSWTGITLTKISAICDSGLTGKLIITPID